ncbi:DUF6303 family protein [Streptomyces erythrochromogenes]|uniref:DUF6303 family protein n=1 Tax=Streptomyces erythrochromogenes TaxID=285574 RepID=UPI003698E6AF
MNKQIFGAQMSLRCCSTTTSPAATDGPRWQLYVAMTGLVSEWPTYTWAPTAEIPTLDERARALRDLGFTLAEGVEWEWTEHAGPDYHPHPARVLMLCSAKVRPLEGGAA